MTITGKEFAALFESIDTPYVPEGWMDELYGEMFGYNRQERCPRAQESPLSANVKPIDIAKAWKMLCAQDWFRDGVERARSHEWRGIAEDVSESFEDLLSWWSVKTGLNYVTEDKYLANDSVNVLNMSFLGAVAFLRGGTVEEVFDKYLRNKFQIYNIRSH